MLEYLVFTHNFNVPIGVFLSFFYCLTPLFNLIFFTKQDTQFFFLKFLIFFRNYVEFLFVLLIYILFVLFIGSFNSIMVFWFM